MTTKIAISNIDSAAIAALASSGGGGSLTTILSLPTSITSNITLSSGNNGLSVGPITVASGFTVNVPAGQRWVII